MCYVEHALASVVPCPIKHFFILKCRYEKYRGCFVVCVGATSTEAPLNTDFRVHVCLGHILKAMPSKSMTANTVLTSALGLGNSSRPSLMHQALVLTIPDAHELPIYIIPLFPITSKKGLYSALLWIILASMFYVHTVQWTVYFVQSLYH